MKKQSVLLYVPLIMVLLLSSCSTFQYTARQVDVNRRNLTTDQQLANLEVDFNKTVTATSDYQVSRKEAMRESEFLCLKKGKVDVVVDPVFKFEYNPFRAKKRWKATVVGYAGKYKEGTKGVIDAVKDYQLEDIEKYKLLTDPNFPQYYYNQGKGDIYNIGTSSRNTDAVANPASVMFRNNKNQNHKAPKIYDPFKAKNLRNAGIYTTSVGAAVALLIGLPCMFANDVDVYDPYWGESYTYTSDAAYAAGATFLTLGCLTAASGIPMWCVGSYRMKHSQENVDVSLGATAQGMGVKVTF